MAPEAQYSSQRVGELARMFRRRSGRSRRWVANEAGVTRREVRALERGGRCGPEVSTRILAVLRNGGAESRAPQLDALNRTLSVAGSQLPVTDVNDPDVVLKVYLDLVCLLRGEHRRPKVPLRLSDLDELSNLLHMPVDEVSSRLLRLMDSALLISQA